MSEDAPSISPADLQERIDRGDPVRVLDVRNRDEVDRWQLSGPAVTVTQRSNAKFIQATVTDSVDEFAEGIDGEGPIVAVCARGEASREVAAALEDAGYEASNLAGGMEAWARLLTAVDLSAGDSTAADDDDTAVVQYRRPASGCLGYMVVSGESATVVDPLRAFTERYVADARERGATVETVVDTHVHADHVSGLRDLADAADAEAVMPAAAVERGVTYDVTTVSDGDEITVGDATLEAVNAPGHTTGMTAFAVRGSDSDPDAADVLLAGDSLFVGSVARPDLERGSEGARDFARDLHRTLTERFARFGDGTLVAPGHHAEGVRPDEDGAVTAPLGELQKLSVFEMDADEFVEYVTADMPPRPANFERVIAINLGQETADAEEAFELELGPNNCAATPADD
jgi:glyoxylase-like metal-dependent hydrolase (beta-lactamase superfamily II)/rhodanese-related sulfurtransferase